MSWPGLCTQVLENPASLRMCLSGRRAGQLPALLRRDWCRWRPPQPSASSPGVTWGLPLSSHRWTRLARAARKASLRPAELPCLTRRVNQGSAKHLRFVRQYLISESLTRRAPPAPGRLRRAVFVCGARRQTAAGKRPSITAPFSLSPQNKGRKRGWWLRWETGAACAGPPPSVWEGTWDAPPQRWLQPRVEISRFQ